MVSLSCRFLVQRKNKYLFLLLMWQDVVLSCKIFKCTIFSKVWTGINRAYKIWLKLCYHQLGNKICINIFSAILNFALHDFSQNWILQIDLTKFLVAIWQNFVAVVIKVFLQLIFHNLILFIQLNSSNWFNYLKNLQFDGIFLTLFSFSL